MQQFHPAVQDWFREDLGSPTDCQHQAWAAIAAGLHTLVAAPTGSGKTLAAFLSAIDDLVREGLEGPLPAECRVLYVSPLKALSNDVQRNLERPLQGIAARLAARGLPAAPVRTMVRTGDTPRSARDAMRRHPPHILVTTPESLFILLTSDGGRRILATVRTVIVDEIHAIAGNKRGAHLSLSLERLAHLAPRPPVRIGLSATQKPVSGIARFLTGGLDPASRPCQVVDVGHVRDRDLALELTDHPLEAVMSHDGWAEVYERLVSLIEHHRTTLVFVNTRRLAERLAHALTERLGEDHVTSHHGSLAREQRLDAERRLKAGELKALVATASLELGIDIGDVDLVCQVGVPGSIATFLQRVGRAGHAVGGISRGRLFPLTRDELVSCTALLQAVEREELDALRIPSAPLDVLSQQLVAMAAAEPWDEAAMFECVREADGYRGLTSEAFTDCLRMLADGFATRRGRRGAYLHRDTVNGTIRARRGARLTAVTNGGAIPDNADFDVVLEPEGVRIGTLNEDFAIESVPGDVFLLGNSPWRVLRIEEGKVRVEDARGLAPNIPFWFGEAPGRSDELSLAVGRLRQQVQTLLTSGDGEVGDASGPALRARAVSRLAAEPGIGIPAAEQLIDYLAAALAALGTLPDGNTVVLERFFDDSGGMQLLVHACKGSRINKAWGLALRKRFCRSFNFELQAAATEDCIVLSLGETHSFPLADAATFVRSTSARDTLTQALLDAPVFEVRWRWNANISLAVPRFRAGRKVPPQIQRMQAEDLVAVAFPDQIACLENLSGPRRIPDHPLVQQTLDDALTEAMDVDGLEAVLRGIEGGTLRVHAVDVTEPSPLAAEILVANPYTFLDDAPAEERRTRAVRTRRHHDPDAAASLSRLDPEAIRRVEDTVRAAPRDADELHDALMVFGALRRTALTAPCADRWVESLVGSRRAAVVRVVPPRGHHPVSFVIAAQRLQQFLLVHPGGEQSGEARTPEEDHREDLCRDAALLELVRARMQECGPVTAAAVAAYLCVAEDDAQLALALLESEGVLLRGHFLDPAPAPVQWCERRILARIHRSALNRTRASVTTVNAAAYMRFLLAWQHLDPEQRAPGPRGLTEALGRLQGAAVPAHCWEAEVLPARVPDFEPDWLDHLCLAGEAAWMRAQWDPDPAARERRFIPLRRTPVMLLRREHLGLWRHGAPPAPARGLQSRVLEALERRGASFFDELVASTGDAAHAIEQALAELSALGLVISDGFAGLRALMRRRTRPGARRPGAPGPSPFAQAGRWSRVVPETWPAEPDRARLRELELARCHVSLLLERFGVVFKALLLRETGLPPWRDLLLALRQMEAQGSVRGGRFVDGFAGEQFALPEAAARLQARAEPTDGRLIRVPGSDPANLTGIVTPGERVPCRSGHAVVYRDGVPVARRTGEQFLALTDLGPGDEWALRALLFNANAAPALAADLLAPAPTPVPRH